jgi:hypothetical protein
LLKARIRHPLPDLPFDSKLRGVLLLADDALVDRHVELGDRSRGSKKDDW